MSDPTDRESLEERLRELEAQAEELQRSREALRQSEARFKAIFERAPVMIDSFDSEGRCLLWNRECEENLGWSREELEQTGDPMALFYPDPEQRRQALDAIRAADGKFREYEAVAKDGSPRTQLWAVQTLPGGQLIGVGVDITERRRAEGRLRESEARLAEAQQIARLGSWEWDIVAETVSWSAALHRLFGTDERSFAVSYESFLDLVHPDDQAVLRERIAATLERDEPYRVSHRIVRPDGEVRHIEGRARLERDGEGRPLRLIGVSQDVSDRMRVERELLDSERRFREMAETIREAFWLFDWKEQKVIYASPAYETIWGRPVESLYRDYSEWGESIHPDDRELARESFERVLTTGGGEPRRYRIVRPDGEERWISDRAFAIRDDEGEVVRIAGIAEDVTDQVLAEQERHRFEAQLQQSQKLESLGLLAGGVAHDFNNILMGVLGNADLALDHVPHGSPARSFIDNIAAAARRAAELANQLLAYSGKGRFVVEPRDLSQIVEEISPLLEVSVTKKAVLRYRLARGLPAIEGDPTQIRQVALNLVTNASEAIGDVDGSITIATGVEEHNAETLADGVGAEDLAPGLYTFLEVADTGCGMDEETRERIFDPFFSTKFTGRGLGLAAVLGIVRGHGGVITSESLPGEGSVMRVFFPATERRAVRETVVPDRSLSWKGEGVALLVDDERTVRAVTGSMLEAIGFQVLTARDGQEAVELFSGRADEIAFVLLDLTMPRKGGAEALQELRSIRDDIPVILSSGYNEQDTTNHFAGRGLAGFIQKPYRLAELRAAVRRALEGGAG